MDSTEKSPVILSICTGLRGIERGIERAIGSCRVAAYVEIEAFATWNLVAAMESGFLDPAPIWTDIKTFPAQHFHKKIHIVTAGYPCQPFSLAGKRNGERDPRHVFPYIASAIEEIRPNICFFENVTGHLSCGFDTVKRTMEAMGYRVEAGIYSAQEVGAPHLRERLFILAVIPNSICSNGYEVQNKNRKPIRGQKSFVNGYPGGADRFPSRRGDKQQGWEAARTTQYRLGCTINGYNFRADFFRALGNSVVEQTAELAFIDLFSKFIK